MRVCFISHGSGRGGAEEVLLETIECLKESDFDVRVLMPGDRGLGEDLRSLGVPYWELPFWPWMGHDSVGERAQVIVRNLLCSVPAYVALRRWNPDIIYSNTMTICFGAILARVLRRPHVWHLHELGYDDHGLKFDFGPKLSYRIINSASACIAVSQITADSFSRHIDPSKLTIITQSVHRNACWSVTSGRKAETFVPAKKRRLRCVIVGRLSKGKRQEDAVLAIAALTKKGIDTELLIIGRDNPGYVEQLQSLIQINRLEDRVTMLVGSVVDRSQFVQSSDVVLMCSRCEAFGRVTVEGMLAGKPVIAANSGANPELIQEGYNGFLYRVRDVSDLAAKIQLLYENPELAKRVGQNARSFADERFNKERFKSDITSFLYSVAETDPRYARQKNRTQYGSEIS